MPQDFDTIVLGAGPAGSGPLVAAAQAGIAPSWLRTGVLWADQGAQLGPGSLPRYGIASDTMAKVLLEALQGEGNPLADLAAHPLARQLADLGERAVPLCVAGAFLAQVGERLAVLLASQQASAFWPNHRADLVCRRRDGSFVVTFAGGQQARGQKILIALGGYQDRAEAARAELLAGVSLRQVPRHRLWMSEDLFAIGGLGRALQLLARSRRAPSIAIVGGSHSAMCAADLLLRSSLAPQLQPGSIKVFCRSLPRPFYPSLAAAHAEGFADFGPQDVCPATGRVFRLAGLRMASRDLLRSVLQLGNSFGEDRVKICLLPPQTAPALRASLADADLVVACLGYRSRGIKFVDESNLARKLAPGTSFSAPRVDGACRLLDADGQPIPAAYGMGLASGFVPHGPVLGGEPSFRGQTNGIWLYQHDLGRLLLRQLGAPLPQHVHMGQDNQLPPPPAALALAPAPTA